MLPWGVYLIVWRYFISYFFFPECLSAFYKEPGKTGVSLKNVAGRRAGHGAGIRHPPHAHHAFHLWVKLHPWQPRVRHHPPLRSVEAAETWIGDGDGGMVRGAVDQAVRLPHRPAALPGQPPSGRSSTPAATAVPVAPCRAGNSRPPGGRSEKEEGGEWQGQRSWGTAFICTSSIILKCKTKQMKLNGTNVCVQYYLNFVKFHCPAAWEASPCDFIIKPSSWVPSERYAAFHTRVSLFGRVCEARTNTRIPPTEI